MTLAPGDPRHGTNNGYQNLRCRCDACREAARLYREARDYTTYRREWSHRTGRSKPLEQYRAEVAAEHGTESMYHGGCRCVECKAASREAKRLRRERSRVPCSHGCGTLVDSINRRDPGKPLECRPCASRRTLAERRAARAAA